MHGYVTVHVTAHRLATVLSPLGGQFVARPQASSRSHPFPVPGGLVIRPTSADTSRSYARGLGKRSCPGWRRAPRPALGDSSDHRVAADPVTTVCTRP